MISENGTTRNCDAIVIGAGPAGCATATILAESGRDVVIVEKERFPRYRIGESLVPYCWFPLNRLGVLDKLEQSGFVVEKRSVQFVSTDGTLSTNFRFSTHTDHACARTWQVKRGEFDTMLLEHAVERGAEAMMETAAKTLVEHNGAVVGVDARRADDAEVRLRAPITVDASGRDSFVIGRSDWRVADPKLRKIALWTYYQGADRDCGCDDDGATTVAYLPDKGWFWFIPLPDDVVSVGIVAERDYLYRGERDPAVIFDREVAAQPWIEQRLAQGRRMADFKVTGDYSYRAKHCARDGLVLVGDAFAFLDPVFSSGVLLALQSGVMAGDAINAALDRSDVSAASFADYGERLCNGLEAMRRLVFAFYDHAFSFAEMIKAHPGLRHDLTDCLIGNLDRDYTDLFRAVGEFADVPAPLAYGRAMVAGSTSS